MSLLFSIGLHNVAVALLLAVLVWGVTRIWKKPPVAHLLWLLVLVKLVTPPVVNLDLWNGGTDPVEAGNEHAADLAFGVTPHIIEGSQFPLRMSPEIAPGDEASIPSQDDKPSSVASEVSRPAVAAQPRITMAAAWRAIRPVLMQLWIGGAGLVALLAGIRIVRFQRRLCGMLPASRRLQLVADELATRMGLRRSPDVRVVDSAAAPLVWCLGRHSTVILPLRLLGALNEHQTAMVLAHELAHVHRRDHWVRVIELVVSVLYWWNPLVRWVRRRLHAAEEQCCDAWVVWAFPDGNHDYAQSLLKAAELSPSRSSPLVLASPFLNAHTLKERIELVLKNRSQRAVSRRAAVCLALLRRRFDPQDEATGMAVGGQLCGGRLHPRRGERMPADVVSVFRWHKGHRQRDCRNREIDEATGSSSCSLQARHRRWHQVAGAIARLREQNSGITEKGARELQSALPHAQISWGVPPVQLKK